MTDEDWAVRESQRRYLETVDTEDAGEFRRTDLYGSGQLSG